MTNIAYKIERPAKSCFWRHDWPKWADIFHGRESYGKDINPSNDGYPVVIQERRCLRCNKVERCISRPERT